MSPIEKEADKLFDNLKKAFEQRHKQSREKAELLEREIARTVERQKSDRYYQSLIVEGQRPPDVMTETVVDRSVYRFKTQQANHMIRTLAEHQYLQWLKEKQDRPVGPIKPPSQAELGRFLAHLCTMNKLDYEQDVTGHFCDDLAQHFGFKREKDQRIGHSIQGKCRDQLNRQDQKHPDPISAELAQFLTMDDPIAALKAAFPKVET